MSYVYRPAVPEDTAACVTVEDLREVGITVESWGEGIRDGTLPGYVCLADDKIVGYCFGNSKCGEIEVVALLPEHEDRGIGKTLLNAMVDNLRSRGFRRLLPPPGMEVHGNDR